MENKFLREKIIYNKLKVGLDVYILLNQDTVDSLLYMQHDMDQ